MTALFEIIAAVSFLLLLYVYAGYPALLCVLWSIAPRKTTRKGAIRPRVSLIVSCYNEADVIREKLENCLSLDYPEGALEVVVVSDASDDGTDGIVERFSCKGVRLVRQDRRLGKTSGLNKAVPLTKGEIIIFSDANAMYERDSIIRLVENFADAGVGYVVGEARYMQAGGNAAVKSEDTYWRYEILLKKMETGLHSIVGADGAIYAIRRELYEELLPTDINDFVNPLQIIARGYRGVYEPQAVCWEEAAGSFGKEFKRKVRIVNRSFTGLLRVKSVMNPFKTGFFSLEIISHKLLRWLAPVFMITFIVSSAALSLYNVRLFHLVNLAVAAFLILGFSGFLLSARSHVPPVFYYPYYFISVNAAALLGIIKSLRGDVQATWSTIREPGQPSR